MNATMKVPFAGRSNRLIHIVAAAAATAVALTACGQSESGAPPSGEKAEVDLTTTVPGAPLEASVWAGIRPEIESAKEIEHYDTVDEAAAASDATAIGTVTRVEAGRVVQGPATMAPILFANFVVSQEDGTEVVFEHPIPVSSRELTDALTAATNPEPTIDAKTGDPLNAIDGEAVATAYKQLWPAAAKESIDRARQSLPKDKTIVLLRKVAVDGSVGLRPLNSAAVIVDDNGRASLPLAPDTHVSDTYTESLGSSFDTLAAQVERAGQ